MPRTTDWNRVAGSLAAECPSSTLQRQAVSVLETLQTLGPLRPTLDEFRRVYQSLQWNEANRVQSAVGILRARSSGPKPQLVVRAEAWGYTIAALDEWTTHARIFYLVIAILESALRARIDARLTDYYGTPDWANVPDAIPSFLRERTQTRERLRQYEKAQALLRRAVPVDTEASTEELLARHDQLLAELRAELADVPPVPQQVGAEFLRRVTTLHDLYQWLITRRFWNEPVRMAQLFRGKQGTAAVPQSDKFKKVFTTLHDARNAMAHYRPEGENLSFVEPLFAAATLAQWLGADIAHIYSAIDTRRTTELSAALDFVGDTTAGWKDRPGVDVCDTKGCAAHPPLAWMLGSAPTHQTELASVPLRRVCLQHRVLIRDADHRRTSAID